MALEAEEKEIEKEKLEERRRKNDLIQERNYLLKVLIKKKLSLPDKVLDFLLVHTLPNLTKPHYQKLEKIFNFFFYLKHFSSRLQYF